MTQRNVIALTEPVAVGSVAIVSGQRYTVLGIRPHIRLDGVETTLVLWQSHCARCGAPFTVTTAMKAHSMNRRCPKHRRPGPKVRGVMLAPEIIGDCLEWAMPPASRSLVSGSLAAAY